MVTYRRSSQEMVMMLSGSLRMISERMRALITTEPFSSMEAALEVRIPTSRSKPVSVRFSSA